MYTYVCNILYIVYVHAHVGVSSKELNLITHTLKAGALSLNYIPSVLIFILLSLVYIDPKFFHKYLKLHIITQ